jgi:hypothetical protein
MAEVIKNLIPKVPGCFSERVENKLRRELYWHMIWANQLPSGKGC